MIVSPIPAIIPIPMGFVNAFALVHEGQITLIDTGPAGSINRIFDAVRRAGFTPRDIRQILATQLHGDHVGSLAALKQATGAVIGMHPAEAEAARAGQAMRPFEPGPGLINHLMAGLMKLVSPVAGKVQPVETDLNLQDGDEVPHTGGLRAVHTPGHTAGHLAFYWPPASLPGQGQHGGVLFVGDAAANLNGLGYSMLYEDVETGTASLRKLSELPFEVALFGHGRPIWQGAGEQFRQKWGG